MASTLPQLFLYNAKRAEKGDGIKMENEKNVLDAKEKQSVISEADDNGVRYYDLNQEIDEGGTLDKNKGKKKSSLKKSLFIFVSIIVGVAVLAGMFAGVVGSAEESLYPEEPYIARLNVEGSIQSSGNEDYFGNPIGYQHQWTLDTIDDLIGDENNKGIILFVDTPGGGVYESDELYFKLREYQEKTGRPIYSSMATMAASGGYYISAPCDKIIANRNCWTGSIGVTMGSYLDFSELLETYGVKVNTITSGENKAMGSSLEPMTDEQKAIFQSLVDEAYEQFVGIVSEGRNMPLEKVYTIADGRIYTAKQALELGLIDGIGTYEEALADLVNTYKLQDCVVTELEPSDDGNILGSIFSNVNFDGLRVNSDVEAIVKLAENEAKFPVSYMCEALDR